MVEVRAKIYDRIEDLPEKLGPGKYIIGDTEIELHEEMQRDEIVAMLAFAKRYKSKGQYI